MNHPPIEELYHHYLTLTGEPGAAASLVLAHSNMRVEPDAPEALSVRQAAKRLGVSTKSIYLMCQSGQLAHKRVGAGRGSIRIKTDDLFRERPAAEFITSRHLAPPTRGRGRPKVKVG